MPHDWGRQNNGLRAQCKSSTMLYFLQFLKAFDCKDGWAHSWMLWNKMFSRKIIHKMRSKEWIVYSTWDEVESCFVPAGSQSGDQREGQTTLEVTWKHTLRRAQLHTHKQTDAHITQRSAYVSWKYLQFKSIVNCKLAKCPPLNIVSEQTSAGCLSGKNGSSGRKEKIVLKYISSVTHSQTK